MANSKELEKLEEKQEKNKGQSISETILMKTGPVNKKQS